eukprot:4796802-Amphidinium_carterae.1
MEIEATLGYDGGGCLAGGTLPLIDPMVVSKVRMGSTGCPSESKQRKIISPYGMRQAGTGLRGGDAGPLQEQVEFRNKGTCMGEA